jgi:hypothetical protein
MSRGNAWPFRHYKLGKGAVRFWIIADSHEEAIAQARIWAPYYCRIVIDETTGQNIRDADQNHASAKSASSSSSSSECGPTS